MTGRRKKISLINRYQIGEFIRRENKGITQVSAEVYEKLENDLMKRIKKLITGYQFKTLRNDVFLGIEPNGNK